MPVVGLPKGHVELSSSHICDVTPRVDPCELEGDGCIAAERPEGCPRVAAVRVQEVVVLVENL